MALGGAIWRLRMTQKSTRCLGQYIYSLQGTDDVAITGWRNSRGRRLPAPAPQRSISIYLDGAPDNKL